MSNFLHGKFIGPGLNALIGETALLRDTGDTYTAQFDDLEKFSSFEGDHAITWRAYPKESFKLTEYPDGD